MEEALRCNHRTGWGTMSFPEFPCQFLCVRTENDAYGVIAVEAEKRSLNSFEENILLSVVGECALSFL
jgi:two-component system sensor histidine kinase KdpD